MGKAYDRIQGLGGGWRVATPTKNGELGFQLLSQDIALECSLNAKEKDVKRSTR